MEVIQGAKELDSMKRNCCKTKFIYLHSDCHPLKPTWCKYHSDGFIIIECSECGKEIIKIAVQDSQQDTTGASAND